MGLARVSPRFAHRPAWRCSDARAVPRSRLVYGARRAPARGRPRRRPYRRGHPGGPSHLGSDMREARLPRDLRFGDLRLGARLMERSAVAAAIDRSAALAMRLHMMGDARTERRHGLAVARRAGLVCLSSTTMPDDLFTRALGYGTFAPATQRQIDAALRHYTALRLPTRFELMHGAVGRAEVRRLERNGFREEKGARQVHVLELARAPRPGETGELRLERVKRAEAVRYAKLASRGFGSKGPIGLLFERGWIRQLRSGRHATAFIGYAGRVQAATGVLVMDGSAAGLYSGRA